jgi:hypothetical protein
MGDADSQLRRFGDLKLLELVTILRLSRYALQRMLTEPVTTRLGGARDLLFTRSTAPCVLPAQMPQIIALTALTALGLSGAPVQEPVHARSPTPHSSWYYA